MNAQIFQAALLWRSSQCVIALTGAGISVPSGIPDFRSPGGLWSRFNPDRVASAWALDHDPRAAWEFLWDALRLLSCAVPNAAHLALAHLEQVGLLKGIITQNIDGLHEQAGSRQVVEFHGNCWKFYCNGCRLGYPADQAMSLKPEDLPWLCDHCGRIIRPGLVFFGEAIPPRVSLEAKRLAAMADLVVIIGTSGDVAPANAIPYHVKHKGGLVLEINLGPTSYGDLADVRLDLPAEECLPALADLLEQS
jgi:NAD-dependent deacetylase